MNKKMILKSLLTLIFLAFLAENISAQKIRIMTFNIRVNVQYDSLNAWPYRKEHVASMILFHHADIVGIQEGLFEQVNDLSECLPDYNWFGVGRDDGKKEGEFSAVFYVKKRFTLLLDSTFWLSETPGIPGRGWDAACTRIVTWGKFKDNITGKIFYHFNTHFDHMGVIAREESAKLLLKSIKNIARDSDVIVTGDFNSTLNSIVYKTLTQGTGEVPDFKLIDSKTVSDYPHHGPERTFTGFKMSNLSDKDEPIDYIFVTKGIHVLYHGTLSDTFDGFLPSDHMPVLAEIMIE